MTIMLSNNSSATLTFKESRPQWKASKLIVDVACTASYPTPNFNTDDVMLFLTGTTHKPYIKAYGAGLWGEVTVDSLLWVQLLDEVNTGTQSLRELWVNEVDKYNSVLAHIQLPVVPVCTRDEGIIYTLPLPLKGDFKADLSFEVCVQVLQPDRDRLEPIVYMTLFMVVEVDRHLSVDEVGVMRKMIVADYNMDLNCEPITVPLISGMVDLNITGLATLIRAQRYNTEMYLPKDYPRH